MEELRIACKNLLVNNIKCEVSEEVIEVLTIATMALILSNEDIAYDRLPKIFQELNIYADNKSVLEISHEKLNNHMEDDSLVNSDAAVTRSLGINDETGEISEQRSLIMSLSALANGGGIINMIEKVTHELIHLMRFGGIVQNNNVLNIKDGISTARFNMDTNVVKRKHYNLEEGIVQFYTLIALQRLYSFIEKENVSDNRLLSKFKKGYSSYNFNCYIMQVQLLEELAKDSTFKRLLDNTFEEDKTPSELALYFNEVMGDGSAFSSLSREIDRFYEGFSANSDTSIRASLEKIQMDILKFKSKIKTYKKA